MRSLSCVLVREGAKDDWFLPTFLRRALIHLCAERFPACAEVNPIRSLHRADHQVPASVLKETAAERGTFDVLLFHRDGAPKDKSNEVIDRMAKAWSGPEPFIPVVPVRETEAWLFADKNALAAMLGVKSVPGGINKINKNVEAISDPKEEFRRLVRSVVGPRATRDHRIQFYYADLAERISIDAAAKIPAFDHWWNDMSETLERLGYRYG